MFMFAHFCGNLPSFYENIWIGNSSQDFKLCILKDSDTTNTGNWYGCMFFSLPSIKMNVTALLKHLCEKRCIKQTSFCEFFY